MTTLTATIPVARQRTHAPTGRGRLLATFVTTAVVMFAEAGGGWVTGSLALWALDTGHTATGVVTNALWGLNNCIAMSGIIRAALWQPDPSTPEEP